jgi:hypothetical protein
MKQRLNTKLMTIILTSLAVGVLAWWVALQNYMEHTSIWNYLFNLGYGAVFAFTAFVAMRGAQIFGRRSNVGRVFLYFGIAMALWAAGLAMWTYDNVITQIDVPYPSVADIPFLLFYPFMGLGLWRLDDITQRTPNSSRLLASLPLILVSMLIVFVVLRRPDLSSSLPLMERLANVAYSLGNAFLISMTLVAWQSAMKHFSRGLYWIITSLMVLAAGDYLFSYRSAKGLYWNGDISDLLYAAFAILFAQGLIHVIKKQQAKS